jgi:phosphoenolpyruvate phosphomutase
MLDQVNPNRSRLRSLSRPAELRSLLFSTGLSFLMEAHNGLSAKIVEEAEFSGIWASGLSISASLGLRDNNEASWTQVLDVLEFMADASSLPILVDGDTGYGNFNNVRRLVRKLGERDIAGVCLEDKLFPKTNSFLGERQLLADTAEFCGRIRAGKDAQTDDDFCIVARTESLISGYPMEEALRRAEAYHAAGADAILVHSKRSDFTEIASFMARWDGRCPIVIVPTMYYATPTATLRAAGISTVIWANHLVRSSITAMRETARIIARSESLMDVEDRIASVREIFRLTGNDELEEASLRYLPQSRNIHGVVLAASRGAALGEVTASRPKCLVDIRGKTLLHRLLDTLGQSGVRDVTVVRGYAREAIVANGFAVVDNLAFAETGEAASLACAMPRLRGELVVSYGDVLFKRYILEGLVASPADVTVVVDSSRRAAANPRDLVAADRHDNAAYLDDAPTHLIGVAVPRDQAAGEWIGLMHSSARGTEVLREELAAMQAEGTLPQADLLTVIDRLRARCAVAVHYIAGHWLDVDTLTDLADARNFS